jgi:hypothetical protein
MSVTGFDIETDSVWLHNFNTRLMILKEGDLKIGEMALPAVTTGVHFKYNDGVNGID